MRPIWRVSRRPTLVQVRPPSVERYTPSPWETLPRMQPSPIPAYTTFASDSATATAPTEPVPSWPSETLAQRMPPSVVFQMPPPVPPK